MGQSSTALFNQIASEFDSLQENHAKFVEKGNKAAGRRARKAASNLKKLLTPYRQCSVDESNSL